MNLIRETIEILTELAALSLFVIAIAVCSALYIGVISP